jgi:hypothetical protein
MLKVKTDRVAATPRNPPTAHYVDRMQHEGRPATLCEVHFGANTG